MKIKLSKSQWEGIGKQAGWMKKAGPNAAYDIGAAFNGLAGGIQEAGKSKVQEYAQRIMKGEPKEQVLQGAAPTMIKNVEQALAQLQQGGQAPQQAPQQAGTQQISVADVSNKLASMGEPQLSELVGRYQGDKNIMWQLYNAANGNKASLQWLKQKFINAQPV